MRILRSSFQIAIRALSVNKLRSSLTILGLVIGVSAVIAMVSIGAGAQSVIENQIASLGSNVIQIEPESQWVNGVQQGRGTAQSLTRQDAIAIRREVPDVAAVAARVRNGAQVIVGNMNWYTRVTGTTSDYIRVHEWELSQGSFFTEYDEASVAKVAVIGETVLEALFPNGENPVGVTMRINRVPFSILGVLKAKGQSPTGSDLEDIILIPLSTAMKRVLGQTGLKADMVRNIDVKAASADVTEHTVQRIENLLRYRHQIAPGAADDFDVDMLTERYEARQEASAVMSLLLASIAGVSLLVGGIGIMNIMLVSVTERTREIGVRQAVGAKTKHILLQFLSEAVTVSLAGGAGGIILGIFISRFIAQWAGWPAVIEFPTVLLAFGFTGLVGIFFGYYPARKAAMLDPIEAIRYE
jgi:putative ABC transport system permease protein